MLESNPHPLPRPAGSYWVEQRIANALERIADALEGPPAPVAPTVNEPVPGICLHPEKNRVAFGADDEWECSRLKGGCGFRSPALVAVGG